MNGPETETGETTHVIEVSERQRERFDRVKEECTEEFVPEPTDDQIVKSLIDTWDAVDDGHYSGGSR